MLNYTVGEYIIILKTPLPFLHDTHAYWIFTNIAILFYFSVYKRSLISVYESRISAKTMGVLGITVLVFIFGFFIVFDCVNISRHIADAQMNT